MSLRNFVRRFKQATGDSPLTYLQKLRVAAAKRLLESNHRTMQEISDAVGYQDVAFFSLAVPAAHRRVAERVSGAIRCVAAVSSGGVSKTLKVINFGGIMDRSLMDIRSLQKPLKEQYRQDPGSSSITLTAKGSETATPLACSVDIGRAIYQAEAHKGVGGSGQGTCSGDLLIGALAACAQLTCRLVATAMGVQTRHIDVTVSGDMDLQGTLGISKDVPVGFESIRVQFNLDAPEATPEQLRALREKTEQYCVVLQTMLRPPKIETRWDTSH